MACKVPSGLEVSIGYILCLKCELMLGVIVIDVAFGVCSRRSQICLAGSMPPVKLSMAEKLKPGSSGQEGDGATFTIDMLADAPDAGHLLFVEGTGIQGLEVFLHLHRAGRTRGADIHVGM